MECPCGHPIVWKKDIAIVEWRKQQFYLHTECFGKYFSVMNTGYCVPTRALLDIIEHKRMVEEKVEAPEVEKKTEEELELREAIRATPSKPEIKCPLCGGQAAYSLITHCYICLDCQTAIPDPEPSK